jgi:mono/diheme cytochrome c family protein
MRRGSVGLIVAAAAAALLAGRPAAAQRAGDPEAGRRLAEAWCGNCHVVGPGASGPASDAVPTFPAVARMPSTTAMSLRVFLQTPHSRMPDLRLSNEHMDDVIAYILSLRDR